MNKQLLEIYKNKNFEDIILYRKPSEYFKSARKFYEDLQDGIADENSFFDNTIAFFAETEKPKRKPDFVSDSGSQYWYSKKGLTRGSNHWGNGVANCDWALKRTNGKTVYGYSYRQFTKFTSYLYGFCPWQDFEFKARSIIIGNDEVITTFANHRGVNKVEYKGSVYEKVITESYIKTE